MQEYFIVFEEPQIIRGIFKDYANAKWYADHYSSHCHITKIVSDITFQPHNTEYPIHS